MALGNTRDSGAVPALIEALRDSESLIRGHAAWALGQIGGQQAMQALENALISEDDETVITEIQSAQTNIS